MTNREDSAYAQYHVFRKLLKEMDNPYSVMGAKTAQAISEELTPRQKQMVQLYYIDQHTMQEIGDMLQVCPSTVCRTLQTARRNLRRCLRYGGRRLLFPEE